MASLYLTIKLNGLGWTPFGSKGKGDQEEEGYKKLAEAIAKMVSQNPYFVDQGPNRKTVSVQIRGYDPIIKNILVANPIPESTSIIL